MPYGIINSDLMTTSDGVSSAGLYGLKNRLINGDMRIDQRNAGASVTQIVANTYTVDRFAIYGSVTSKFTAQQNAASVTPPAGFTNYLGITSSSAYSVLTGDYFGVYQNIEGFNTSDLAWGTANAQTITLSFWVRSSLTGTFGGSLLNNGYTRSYPFTFTINSANTWEKETITITGDTSGTWLTNNGVGVRVWFNLGAGATYSGTANAWSGASSFAPTGATSVIGTNGATFYITGVQLEKGSTATSYDYLDYGRSLMQCQRYYEKSYNVDVAPATITSSGCANGSRQTGSGVAYVKHAVVKRASPTVTVYSTATGTSGQVRNAATGSDEAGAAGNIGDSGFNVTPTTSTLNQSYFFQWVSAIEL
jgi:hypothetical protein